MAASPSVQATRPSGWIDLRRPAEYPIILGDSLKDDSGSANQLLNLRYNWQPKVGFVDSNSTLTNTDKGYRLVVKDENDSDAEAFTYSGHQRSATTDTIDTPKSLALFFNKKKSVFVLESISTSIDLNLVSAPGQASEDIRAHPKLSKQAKPSGNSVENNGDASPPEDDDTPDPSNPYDFRNFLAEAKENLEKGQQTTGARTPIPGNRTPLSGFGSPVAGAHKFLSTTPNFRSGPTSAPLEPKKKLDQPLKSSKLTSPVRTRHPPLEHKPGRRANQPLSKERISDSDEELSDVPADLPRSVPLTKPPPPKVKGHNRQVSDGIGRSPHIVVNDGDLEIDMGSPPQEAIRKRGRIDPGAFRSHTGTPVFGRSPNPRRTIEHDTRPKEPEQQDREEDDDVEVLDLGSPRTDRHSMSNSASRDVSMLEPHSPPPPSNKRDRERERVQEHEHEAAPTPTNQGAGGAGIDDDDDEDLLAKELEEALGEEDEENDAAAHGLGIMGTAGGNRMDEDESEISEEE